MHIILDANVYASDYRMSGVSFRTLFDYMRRTESQMVLPRLIREEVVCDYGRKLKSQSKAFADIHNRYRRLDLDNKREVFREPDIRRAMKKLRRMLMKPQEGVTPIYIPEIKEVSIDEVFIRGVRRIRPANEQGEELRDVIIWLWALHYSTLARTEVAFVSNDSTFWSKDGAHPQVEKDKR
jgi:hypothetical protein